MLEDAESVQVAISAVVNALAGHRMTMKQATALLYGLQLAAMNCRNLPPSRSFTDKLLRPARQEQKKRKATEREPGKMRCS